MTKREARPLWLTASCGTPRSRTPCLALNADGRAIACGASCASEVIDVPSKKPSGKFDFIARHLQKDAWA